MLLKLILEKYYVAMKYGVLKAMKMPWWSSGLQRRIEFVNVHQRFNSFTAHETKIHFFCSYACKQNPNVPKFTSLFTMINYWFLFKLKIKYYFRKFYAHSFFFLSSLLFVTMDNTYLLFVDNMDDISFFIKSGMAVMEMTAKICSEHMFCYSLTFTCNKNI